MTVFFTNHYDFLFKQPMLCKRKFKPELEELTQRLQASGLLRISAYDRCNFVIYPVMGGKKHLSFSKIELFEEDFLPKTKQIIAANLKHEEKQDADYHVNHKIEILQKKLAKYIEILPEDEINLCRLLVQSAHPVIIKNIIADEVKIFISYGDSISDLLDVSKWQTSRYSNGLQSTDYKTAEIYISCGGSPFFDPEESQNPSDGPTALSKLMIVAAQEIAHYADIIIDSEGTYLNRFSCSLNLSTPNLKCNKYRLQGLKIIKKVEKNLHKTNLAKLYDLENRLKIQTKYRKFSWLIFKLRFQIIVQETVFKQKALENELNFYEYFNNKEFLATEIYKCLGDMRFNLEPKANDYKNDDKNIENAIACAEALARIPQQELKWGKDIVQYFSPYLQKYYYNFVVKSEIARYKNLYGKIFATKNIKSKRQVK